MTSIGNVNNKVYLAHPSTMIPRDSISFENTTTFQNDSISISNTNIVPNNYPSVSNNVPTNIFNNPITNNTSNNSTNNNNGLATNNSTNINGLKPVTMTEAQWAVKFEEKVLKKGYQPTQQEMAKYQDIVKRFQANPNVDSSIWEILAAQSSSLGSQVASMRYGKNVAEALRGLKPGGGTLKPIGSSGVSATENIVSGGVGSSLRGLGSSLLKGTGLSAIVSGGFSLITNGIQVLQGKKTWSEVSGTVAADTANGAVSGLTGTLAAGGATLLAGALGATGLAGTLLVGLGAMGGAWLGDKLFRGTGLYDKIKDTVSSFFNKETKQNTTITQFSNNQYLSAQTYQPKMIN